MPASIAARARWISFACMTVLAAAVVEQIVETFTDAIENPWLGVALGFLSSAALGIDAIVVGVRRQRGYGPSIKNLAPGGWATFGSMMWVLAVPAYFFGARRRALRGDDDIESEPLTIGNWVAIAVPFAIGLFATFAALIT